MTETSCTGQRQLKPLGGQCVISRIGERPDDAVHIGMAVPHPMVAYRAMLNQWPRLHHVQPLAENRERITLSAAQDVLMFHCP